MFSRRLQQARPPPSPASDFRAGIMITVLILAIAVILSASFYLFLKFLRRHRHRFDSSSSSAASPTEHRHRQRPNIGQVSPAEKNSLVEALPLFTFDSLAGGRDAGGDCAVCLSKFEAKDLLRLLPICCHAFHAECIDTWLAANQSCPLCRSPIFVSENDLIGKFSLLRQNSLSTSSSSSSFRVEIGNVSRRGPANSGEIRRSYSIGDSFDYVLDDTVAEVPAGSFRMPAEFKAEQPTAPPLEEHENLAAEVGPRGGWLKEYLSYSLSSSRTASFRSSGRWFFTGSSRRSATTTELAQPELDLEAGQLSNEIGELFRWLSGV